MMPVSVFRKKSFYIVLVLIGLGGIGYWRYQATKQAITYETIRVERRDVAQTVEVTGSVRPTSRRDLGFRMNGTIGLIHVKKGDQVKKGDLLAELQNENLIFAIRSAQTTLSIAEANLALRLAGETTQSIRVAETSVDQAEAAYDKAISDFASARLTTAHTVRTAELAWQKASNDLVNADAIASQNVRHSYETVRTTLLNALGPIHTSLTDGDTIIGVDNSASGGQYASVLGIYASGSVDQAKVSYALAKKARDAADGSVRALSIVSTQDQILTAADLVERAIADTLTYLTDVQRVLGGTATNVVMTTAQLAAYQSTIATDRTSASTQNTAVNTAVQTIKNTELTRTQTIQALKDTAESARVAYDSAKTTAETMILSAETAVTTTKAAWESTKATLDLKKSGPRPVDTAPLHAAVEQARVAYEKAAYDLDDARIMAPADGTIADVIPDVGEQVAMNASVIRMVSAEFYTIEAQVPEIDIAKIQIGQTATMTLDAYGDDVKFSGFVTAKDPDQTKVQDAVYYKITLQIDATTRDIKPGMTANVVIKTGEQKNALSISLRAIRTRNGEKIVRVLEADNGLQERLIQIGLRGDEGRVEVVSGLQEDERVIVGETTKK